MSRVARTLAAASLVAASLTAQDAPSFHRDVLPILQARCTGCHQPAKAKDGIVLTSHDAVLRGHGADEPIVVAGDPDGSVLLDVVVPHGGVPPEMPEDGEPLSDTEVGVLRAWIAAGAIDDTPESMRSLVRPDAPPTYRTPPVIPSLAWSPDATLLAVPGRHEVLLWSADAGDAPVARLVGLAERIESVAFAPDGTRLLAVGGAPARFGEVQVWDVASRELLLSRIVTHDCLFGGSWSPDGTRVAFGATDTVVRAIDAKTGADVLFQGAHDDWVLDTTFSTDGSHLVSVGRDRTMKLIKVESQQFIDNITSITPGALKGGLIAVDRHPQRDELLVGGADGTPKLYKMYREKKRVIGDDFNLIRAFAAMPGRVFGVAFVGDGSRIVAVGSDARGGAVHAYRTEDGELLWHAERPAGIYALAVAPDGARLAVAGFSGHVEILAMADGAVLRDFVPVPLAIEAGANDGGVR